MHFQGHKTSYFKDFKKIYNNIFSDYLLVINYYSGNNNWGDEYMNLYFADRKERKLVVFGRYMYYVYTIHAAIVIYRHYKTQMDTIIIVILIGKLTNCTMSRSQNLVTASDFFLFVSKKYWFAFTLLTYCPFTFPLGL